MRLAKGPVAPLGILLLILPAARAETFEALTFTPPPGFTAQTTPEGRIYIGRQPNGTGSAIIALYNSQPGNLTAAQAFNAYWRLHIEKAFPGPAPQPKLGQDGGYAFAAGNRTARNAQGVPMSATLAAFTGQGRTFGAMGVATGDELARMVYNFFGTLRIATATRANTAPSEPAPTGPELTFDPPPGYTTTRQGPHILLNPINDDKQTPCAYVITPPRPTKGNLDADAESALLELYPGWQRMDSTRRVMKGTAPTGWPYLWTRAHIWEGPSAFSKRALSMALALPAGPQRVQIILGRGNPFCTYEEPAFVQLLNSLRPAGWTSDGGKALARDLLGTWRWTNGYTAANALMQYTFQPGGRFTNDTGATTRLGVTETTTTTVRGGQYTLTGNQLQITRENGERKLYRIRIYDESAPNGWNRVLSLLDETANLPAIIDYYRVE